MSVTTNHLLLIFQEPQYGLHDVPPHDLARHKGETDWPVVPSVLLLALLEDKNDICFLLFFQLPC